MAKTLEKTEDVLSRAYNNLQVALDFDYRFGTIFTMLGYKISTSLRCTLDWVLVDVQYTRRGENKVCTFYLITF
jgi:hypothetical protein